MLRVKCTHHILPIELEIKGNDSDICLTLRNQLNLKSGTEVRLKLSQCHFESKIVRN